MPLEFHSRTTPLGGHGVEVRDISFAGPARNGASRASSLLHHTAGKHPAVIYAHGARRQPPGDARSSHRRWPNEGAVALTLTMIYSPRPSARRLPQGHRRAFGPELEPRPTRCARSGRSVDLLRSLARSLTKTRSGTSAGAQGARMGAVTSGVEHRIRAFDLIAGGAAPVSEYVAVAPPDLQDELTIYLEQDGSPPLRRPRGAVRAPVPGRSRGRDRPGGRSDGRLRTPGSEPKDVRWYHAGHVPNARTWTESRDWLSDRPRLDEQPSVSLVLTILCDPRY